MAGTHESRYFDTSQTHESLEEHIVVGERAYIVGPDIDLTPEAITDFVRSSVGRLAIARQVTDAGEFVTMQRPLPFRRYPYSPSPPSLGASDADRENYNWAMEAHMSAINAHRQDILSPREQVSVPPAIGHPSQTESDSYFYIDNPDSGITSVIPYKGISKFLHRLQMLEIVG